MNENLDLTKILDGCPRGTKFYSSVCGEVSFERINISDECPIILYADNKNIVPLVPVTHTKDGKFSSSYDGECTLFPSKDQRDWSKFERFWDKPTVEKFDLKTLQPFDRVLVRDTDYFEWNACLFSHISSNEYAGLAMCDGAFWKQVIPYNDETKHLLGTNEDCPEYYKCWED